MSNVIAFPTAGERTKRQADADLQNAITLVDYDKRAAIAKLIEIAFGGCDEHRKDAAAILRVSFGVAIEHSRNSQREPGPRS